MHSISFAALHRSIVALETTELPPFVLLTGRNGSGKSHLLEALNEGKVRTTLTNDFTNSVRLFDWNSIVPKDTGLFDPAQDQTRRSQWFSQIAARRELIFPQLQQSAIGFGIPAAECSSVERMTQLTPERIGDLVGSPERAAQIHAQLQQQLASHGQNVYSQTAGSIPDQGWKTAAPRLMKRNPSAFYTANQAEFFEQDELLWGEVDPFQQAFGRVFTSYRGLLHSNDRLEKYPPPNSSRHHLGNDGFVAEYGPPPWEFVNRILQECQLDFRVDFPPLHETTSYEPKLTKQRSGAEIRFKDLSSGEKVLMSFALCLYNAQERRQEKAFPNLLLLDEVDAPLHPSMTLSLLRTITNVLGIGVKIVYR